MSLSAGRTTRYGIVDRISSSVTVGLATPVRADGHLGGRTALSPPNGLELSCPAEVGNRPSLYARPAGDSSIREAPARRVSFSELLGGPTEPAGHVLSMVACGISKNSSPHTAVSTRGATRCWLLAKVGMIPWHEGHVLE